MRILLGEASKKDTFGDAGSWATLYLFKKAKDGGLRKFAKDVFIDEDESYRRGSKTIRYSPSH